jgi:hypothetical protein
MTQIKKATLDHEDGDGKSQLVNKKVNGLFSEDRAERYECAAFLHELSRKRPCALYPYFNSLADLLSDEDPIIRLEMSEIVWQVARVDCQNKSNYLTSEPFPTLGRAVATAG